MQENLFVVELNYAWFFTSSTPNLWSDFKKLLQLCSSPASSGRPAYWKGPVATRCPPAKKITVRCERSMRLTIHLPPSLLSSLHNSVAIFGRRKSLRTPGWEYTDASMNGNETNREARVSNERRKCWATGHINATGYIPAWDSECLNPDKLKVIILAAWLTESDWDSTTGSVFTHFPSHNPISTVPLRERVTVVPAHSLSPNPQTA